MIDKKTILIFCILSLIFSAIAFAFNLSADQTDSSVSQHAPPGAACISCHEEDEPHEGTFGRDCSICHAPDIWDQLGFDHGLSSFPLIGAHTEIDCEACHEQAPDPTSTRHCQDCHLGDEPHTQHLGNNCAHCHTPNGWEYRLFNHDLETSFPLQGAHQGLECEACHLPGEAQALEISKDCAGCHRKDDTHRGDFGMNCSRCHQPTEFKDINMQH